jgi:predicted transcriptional regulator
LELAKLIIELDLGIEKTIWLLWGVRRGGRNHNLYTEAWAMLDQLRRGDGMKNEPDHTFLISVHPRWARAFFLSHNPKTIELRKGSFGASLQPDDSMVIYSTRPIGKAIGTVRVIKHEFLAVDQLSEKSQQGILAKVSRTQFDAYYTSQESGIGVWLSAAELWQSPITLSQLR